MVVVLTCYRTTVGVLGVTFSDLWHGIVTANGVLWPEEVLTHVTPIDHCHLPRTICHQDPGRCAEGMNGLVKAGCPGDNNARDSLRCQQSLGTSDAYRWETATDAQVAPYPG